MRDLPQAFALSLAQLGDPALLRILMKTVAITLAIFAALGFAASFGFDALLQRFGISGESGFGALLAILVVLIAGWLLFRLVALAVLQFFAEDVVRAVEARHYPHAAALARPVPFVEGLRHSTGSTFRAILANLAALPVAALLAATAVGAPLVFFLVNAVLLGRELQDMVWLRHRTAPGARGPVGRPTRFLLGGTVAALLAVPFVNLLAPVIGAAAATHLVHRRNPS